MFKAISYTKYDKSMKFIYNEHNFHFWVDYIYTNLFTIHKYAGHKYILETTIVQFTSLTSSIDKIIPIQCVFTQNERIWQRKVSLCLVNRNTNS